MIRLIKIGIVVPLYLLSLGFFWFIADRMDRVAFGQYETFFEQKLILPLLFLTGCYVYSIFITGKIGKKVREISNLTLIVFMNIFCTTVLIFVTINTIRGLYSLRLRVAEFSSRYSSGSEVPLFNPYVWPVIIPGTFLFVYLLAYLVGQIFAESRSSF